MVTSLFCRKIIVLFFLILLTPIPVKAEPVLVFSDLINGPAEGLGDNLGQGAIVTVWGQQLGDEPGQVLFTDSNGDTRQAAHIYYWKKADGKAPGGPANLYKSHHLYEIAFSIPNSAKGSAKIKIETANGNLSNDLPFSVAEGKIFHVKANGNNSMAGSFEFPWQFINGERSGVKSPGNQGLSAGDILYTHGVTERITAESGGRAAIFLRLLKGTPEKNIALVSYPGTVAQVESPSWGIHPYLSSALVISKFRVEGGNMPTPAKDAPYTPPITPSTLQIKATSNGRIIGNYVTDLPGQCSNGMAGSISGTGYDIDNLKVLGNEITDIGCPQTSHFHHTTYLSRRSNKGEPDIQAPEVSWNYLHDNMARYGIHIYDETSSSTSPCDHVTGDMKVHNNKVINQRGPGINIYTAGKGSACWKTDVYITNNTLVNTGLGPRSEPLNGTAPYGIKIGGSIAGHFFIEQNIIYQVSDESSRQFNKPAMIQHTSHHNQKNATIKNNWLYTLLEMPLMQDMSYADFENNEWYIEGFNDFNAIKKINIQRRYKNNNIIEENNIIKPQ